MGPLLLLVVVAARGGTPLVSESPSGNAQTAGVQLRPLEPLPPGVRINSIWGGCSRKDLPLDLNLFSFDHHAVEQAWTVREAGESRWREHPEGSPWAVDLRWSTRAGEPQSNHYGWGHHSSCGMGPDVPLLDVPLTVTVSGRLGEWPIEAVLEGVVSAASPTQGLGMTRCAVVERTLIDGAPNLGLEPDHFARVCFVFPVQRASDEPTEWMTLEVHRRYPNGDDIQVRRTALIGTLTPVPPADAP